MIYYYRTMRLPRPDIAPGSVIQLGRPDYSLKHHLVEKKFMYESKGYVWSLKQSFCNQKLNWSKALITHKTLILRHINQTCHPSTTYCYRFWKGSALMQNRLLLVQKGLISFIQTSTCDSSHLVSRCAWCLFDSSHLTSRFLTNKE